MSSSPPPKQARFAETNDELGLGNEDVVESAIQKATKIVSFFGVGVLNRFFFADFY